VFTYRLGVGVKPDALRAIGDGRYNAMGNPIWQRFRRRFCTCVEREDRRPTTRCRCRSSRPRKRAQDAGG